MCHPCHMIMIFKYFRSFRPLLINCLSFRILNWIVQMQQKQETFVYSLNRCLFRYVVKNWWDNSDWITSAASTGVFNGMARACRIKSLQSSFIYTVFLFSFSGASERLNNNWKQQTWSAHLITTTNLPFASWSVHRHNSSSVELLHHCILLLINFLQHTLTSSHR